MTRRTPAYTALLLCACLFAAGCQTTPLTRVAIGRELYALTLDRLADARAAGRIDDRAYLRIEVARAAAAAALDDAERAAVAGDGFSAEMALAAFNKSIEALLAARARAQGAATQPTGGGR